MAKNDNLVHYLTDIADAIREKNGTSDPINAQDFADEIKNSGGNSGSSKWTGHADAEGLKAIGWTDEDIAYYQEHGVNWNEEDDEYHKVTDDNKALYGVLTADNISTYKDRIVYLPKIDTSEKTTMSFYGHLNLVSIPQLDTSKFTSMTQMFYDCYSLTSIPQLDTTNVTNMNSMFRNCYSLTSIPQLDTSKVMNIAQMFRNCYSLTSIPQLDTSKVNLFTQLFDSCYSLVAIPHLDTSSATYMTNSFASCFCLTHVKITKTKTALDLSKVNLLSKASLLYLINNEAATSAITIKLASYAYIRLANDPDILAALANHPNISIAQ